MASIEILDKGDKTRERFKVTYDIRSWNDKRHRRSKTFPVGTGKREVERFKRQVEMEYEDGETIDMSKRKFDDFAKEYFANYIGTLSATTQNNYKRLYYNEVNGLKKTFGNIELSKIKPLTIQKYVNEMRDNGVSPKTIRNYVMLLHTMFNKAMRLRYIKRDFNPTEEVDLPKVRRPRVEAYTEEELKILLKLMDECDDEILSACVKIMVGTGIRRGEVCGLRIENYSSENKEIEITETIVHAGKKDVVKEPKSDSGNRTISLPDTVVGVLDDLILRYKKNKIKYGKHFKDSGYILCKEDGSPFPPTLLTNRFKKYMDKHTDELRYLSLHKLRHTFASLSIKHNMDIKALQETLGHSDASTTLNTYSHGYKSAKQNQAKIMEEEVFKRGVS